MSLRTRLSSALHALLREPSTPSRAELAKALYEQQKLAEYERDTRRRYELHLDDIRCDLADAGIPIPEEDDPELTPRRMVRTLFARWDDSRAQFDDLLDESIAACDILGIDRTGDYDYLATLREVKARADGVPAKPTREIPEPRRLAILAAVAELTPNREIGPSAAEVGRLLYQFGSVAFGGHRCVGSEIIAENARRLIGEGYLSSNGKQGGPLALTEKGREALDSGARVAS